MTIIIILAILYNRKKDKEMRRSIEQSKQALQSARSREGRKKNPMAQTHHYAKDHDSDVEGDLAFEDPEWGRLSPDASLVQCIICEPPYREVSVGSDRSFFHFCQSYNAAKGTDQPVGFPQALEDNCISALRIARTMRILHLRRRSDDPLECINPYGIFISANGQLAIRVPGSVMGGFEEQRWNAPESKRQEDVSQSIDIFSLGLVMWQLVCRETPFGEIDPYSAATRIAAGHRPSTRDLTSSPLNQLIQECWEQEPTSRPPLNTVISQLESISGSGAENPNQYIAIPQKQKKANPLDKQRLGGGGGRGGAIPMKEYSRQQPTVVTSSAPSPSVRQVMNPLHQQQRPLLSSSSTASFDNTAQNVPKDDW